MVGGDVDGFINLKLRIWVQFVIVRKAWDDLAQRAKTHVGLQCQEEVKKKKKKTR